MEKRMEGYFQEIRMKYACCPKIKEKLQLVNEIVLYYILNPS